MDILRRITQIVVVCERGIDKKCKSVCPFCFPLMCKERLGIMVGGVCGPGMVIKYFVSINFNSFYNTKLECLEISPGYGFIGFLMNSYYGETCDVFQD